MQVEENEEVVEYALHHRHVKIVDSGLNFGRPGLTKYDAQAIHSIDRMLRVYLYLCIHPLNHGALFGCPLVSFSGF